MDEPTPDALDEYARRYYLRDDVPDIDIEDRIQLRVARIIADVVPPGARVLEMGWGTGVVVPALVELGLRPEVVEGSPLLCAAARRAVPGLEVHEALFEEFSPQTPYDVVLSLFILEHVDDPVAVLRRAVGWTARGGRVIAFVPNAESLHRQAALRMGLVDALDELSDRDRLVGHRRVYTLERLGADAAAAGLEVERELGGFLKVVPNARMLGWPPELLEAMHEIGELVPERLRANVGIIARRR